MLHAGLDLSRKQASTSACWAMTESISISSPSPPDVDSLRQLARRIEEVHRQPVCAVIESMTGARIVHDTLEREGWSVEIADAQKVKGLAPLACKTDRIDSHGAGHALPARPGAGDLAARPERCRRSASSPAFASTWSSTSRRSRTGSTRP